MKGLISKLLLEVAADYYPWSPTCTTKDLSTWLENKGVNFDHVVHTLKHCIGNLLETMGEGLANAALERPVHTLKFSIMRDIGAMLSETFQGKDGHSLSHKLGYNQRQYDQFVSKDPTNPGYEMLRHWATNNGNTVRVLRNKLRELGRDDVISHLAKSIRGK